MYHLEYDRSAHLLTSTQKGVLTTELATAYALDLQREMMAGLARSPDLRILIDASESQVQPGASFAALSRLGGVFPNPPRTAVVVSSALAKMQAVRGILSPSVQTFTTKAEALDWLMAPPGETG